MIAARGNYSAAAAFLAKKWSLPCTRAYVKRRVESSAALYEVYADIRDSVVDKAESNIFSAVEAGDYNASVYLTRTLGKDRGYVPKQELDGKLESASLVEAIMRGKERAQVNTASRQSQDGGAPAEGRTPAEAQ